MSMRKVTQPQRRAHEDAEWAEASCACGAVRLAIQVPALWAWHDHGRAGRRAHGGAYATYVGSWKSRFRLLEGADRLIRYEDLEAGTARSFCRNCGAPMLYERARAPKIVNIPRGAFETRTGREPRYHVRLEEAADWTWRGEPLSPLKGYPGVMWARPRRSKRRPAAAEP